MIIIKILIGSSFVIWCWNWSWRRRRKRAWTNHQRNRRSALGVHQSRQRRWISGSRKQRRLSSGMFERMQGRIRQSPVRRRMSTFQSRIALRRSMSDGKLRDDRPVVFAMPSRLRSLFRTGKTTVSRLSLERPNSDVRRRRQRRNLRR